MRNTLDFYTFASKIKGEEGTLIDIQKEDTNSITIKWDTGDYECGMLIERENENTQWDLRYVETQLTTWTADGSFQDYSDEGLWDFVEEGLTTWESLQ